MENSTVLKPNVFVKGIKKVGFAIMVVTSALFLVTTASVVYKMVSKDSGKVSSTRLSPVEILRASPVSAITKEQAADASNSDSPITTLQRDSQQKSFKGQVVEWELQIANVERQGGNYLITNNPGPKFSFLGHSTKNLESITVLTPSSPEEAAVIESMKPGQFVKIKAKIQGFHFGNVLLEPAVIAGSTPSVPKAVPLANSTATKILSKEDAEEANELARSRAHDKAQEENMKELQEAGEFPNISTPKVIEVNKYGNRFTADCSSSKQRDAITLGGMDEKEAIKLAATTCKEAKPNFLSCIAKPGTTYKACYSGALISAE